MSTGDVRRLRACEVWWQKLPEFDRRKARLAAASDEPMPADVFLPLADAHVLTVTAQLCADVAAGWVTFPMPRDIRAYVRGLPPSNPGPSPHSVPALMDTELSGLEAPRDDLRALRTFRAEIGVGRRE